MSDLLNRIAAAQREAGERVVVDRLKARGLGEIVNPHVMANAETPKPDFARMAQVLREHWLTGIECNHEAKTDVATCFCSRWRSAEQPNVGQAVERWVEHVIGQMEQPK